MGVHTCSSSQPQIKLLINRPTPTWQSLSFSITISTISQILLIWRNPKPKQSSPPSSAQPTEELRYVEPGALLHNGFWMVGTPEPTSLPFLPPHAVALDTATSWPLPGGVQGQLPGPSGPFVRMGFLPFCILGFSIQGIC